MAVFSLGSGTDTKSLDSMEKVKSYLYRLTEQLKYTFSNLDPEENFDERAKLIYAANQQRQAELEISVDGIRASLNDYEKGVEAMIQVTVDGIIQQYATKESVASIQLTVDGIIQRYATKDSVSQIQLTVDGIIQQYATKDSVSQIQQTVDGIALDYCTSNNVVSKINLGREGVAINAAQINLNGVVTANNNFKILNDGSMEAVNGKFSGSITTFGTGDNPKFLYVSDGSLTGGRGTLTNQSGVIAFDEYVAVNGNPVPAMRIASDALLIGGQVYTTTQSRQGGTMDVYMGQTTVIRDLITDLDITGGNIYWDAVTLVYVNGLLVGGETIRHWDEDEYDPGPL